MDKQQQKELTRWKYLLTGITWKHQQAWRESILKEQGLEAAELFDKRVRYVTHLKQ